MAEANKYPMPINPSKPSQERFWRKWRKVGAVRTPKSRRRLSRQGVIDSFNEFMFGTRNVEHSHRYGHLDPSDRRHRQLMDD